VSETPRPTVFIPHAQHPDMIRPSVVVRTAVPLAAAAPLIRARLNALDPQLVVLAIRPMDEVVSGALSRPRFNLLLLSSFAIVALALSAIGIYGVLAHLVAQRTREIGIRMALGAPAGDVVRLVLGEGMGPVAAGVLAGLAASAATTRIVRTMLFGVTLAAVALLACYLPARRATRVDPLVALRDQ
jgi:putative ABC transport system permease protein